MTLFCCDRIESNSRVIFIKYIWHPHFPEGYKNLFYWQINIFWYFRWSDWLSVPGVHHLRSEGLSSLGHVQQSLDLRVSGWIHDWSEHQEERKTPDTRELHDSLQSWDWVSLQVMKIFYRNILQLILTHSFPSSFTTVKMRVKCDWLQNDVCVSTVVKSSNSGGKIIRFLFSFGDFTFTF